MPYDVAVEAVEPCVLCTVHAGAAVAPAVEAALGCRLPRAGLAGGLGERRVLPVGPEEWLVVAPAREERALLDALEAALSEGGGAAVLVSDGYVAIAVRGPEAVDVLSQAIALDLHPRAMPDGTVVRCGFGKDFAIVHCLESARDFVVYVDAALERYARRLLEVARGGPDVC